jgi:cytochrome c-type biogenesis protein CcmH
MKPVRGLLLAIAALSLAGAAYGQAETIETPLADPALEARAQALGAEIRCVVCENEPVSRSNAPMAIDMRRAIRARVAAGDDDDQVREYFAERYGEFVLLRPRLSAQTLALWAFF